MIFLEPEKLPQKVIAGFEADALSIPLEKINRRIFCFQYFYDCSFYNGLVVRIMCANVQFNSFV